MTEDDLYDLLSPLADGRVYPYVVPLGSDGLPDVPAPYIIFSIPTDVPGMFSAARQNRHCAFRLMYGLKRMTKPGRYAWMPWLACRCFHLSR
jgi:hypothetical protein